MAEMEMVVNNATERGPAQDEMFLLSKKFSPLPREGSRNEVAGTLIPEITARIYGVSSQTVFRREVPTGTILPMSVRLI